MSVHLPLPTHVTRSTARVTILQVDTPVPATKGLLEQGLFVRVRICKWSHQFGLLELSTVKNQITFKYPTALE